MDTDTKALQMEQLWEQFLDNPGDNISLLKRCYVDIILYVPEYAARAWELLLHAPDHDRNLAALVSSSLFGRQAWEKIGAREHLLLAEIKNVIVHAKHVGHHEIAQEAFEIIVKNFQEQLLDEIGFFHAHTPDLLPNITEHVAKLLDDTNIGKGHLGIIARYIPSLRNQALDKLIHSSGDFFLRYINKELLKECDSDIVLKIIERIQKIGSSLEDRDFIRIVELFPELSDWSLNQFLNTSGHYLVLKNIDSVRSGAFALSRNTLNRIIKLGDGFSRNTLERAWGYVTGIERAWERIIRSNSASRSIYYDVVLTWPYLYAAKGWDILMALENQYFFDHQLLNILCNACKEMHPIVWEKIKLAKSHHVYLVVSGLDPSRGYDPAMIEEAKMLIDKHPSAIIEKMRKL